MLHQDLLATLAGRHQGRADGMALPVSTAPRPFYNPGVPHHRLTARPSLSVWARLGVLLGFLAVLAALLAPVSLLAEEVRTGKLGGICSAGPVWAGSDAGSDSGQAPPAAAHCDWCCSVALALPPLPTAFIPSHPGFARVQARFPADLATSITGLPFSRGPPG